MFTKIYGKFLCLDFNFTSRCCNGREILAEHFVANCDSKSLSLIRFIQLREE